MSIGIYKYENKINGHIYIGQSNCIERRYEQHLTESKSERAKKGIDAAIKKYGIKNFTFEIIEECPQEELDKREMYWISYYDSYNNGYNLTIGGKSLKGENHPRAILTEQEVWDIREKYGQKIRRSEVFQPYLNKGIAKRTLLKVWNCENWTTIHTDVYTDENKAWHKKQVGHSDDQIGLSSLDRAIKQKEIDIWVKEYNEGMSINAIAQKYQRDNGTIEKYIHNPVEKIEIKYNGRVVQNIETQKVFKSINSAAKWAHCGATTLTRHLLTDKAAGKIPETNEIAHWIEIL